MRVDVIVPTLGTRREWLNMCLASIRAQSVPDVRVILVTPAAERVSNMVSTFDCEVVVAPPAGLSAALNAGLDRVRPDADFITWLGDDDVLAPGSLEATTRAMEADERAPFAYGRIRMINESSETICVQWSTRFAHRTLRIGQQHVAQPGSLIRSAALRALDPPRLKESLRNAMDLDLFIRLSALGRPAYVAREVAAYRWHSQSITMTKGASDEAEDVRRLSQGPALRATRMVWRPLISAFDRTFTASAWHLNHPPSPLVDGRPYTGGDR